MNTCELSVVVPTLGRLSDLEEALASIRNQDFDSERYEIVVVDNSREGVARSRVEASAGVRYVHEPRPGLHRARHAGAKAARSSLLLFTDDDVVAPRGWVGSIRRGFDSGFDILGGAVIGRWEGQPEPWFHEVATRENCGSLSLLDLGPGLRELRGREVVFGCNFGVRKQVLEKVGGFNPDYFPPPDEHWGGDGESGLIRKVQAAGGAVGYSREAWLEHRVPAGRLTRDYFRNRYIREGVSKAYTVVRRARGSPGRVTCFRWLALARAAWLARRGQAGVRPVGNELMAIYMQSAAHHARRILSEPELRDFVLRGDYWDA